MRVASATIAACLLQAATGATAGAQIEHVIHVSVDGLRGDLLLNLVVSDTTGAYAGFARFIDEGATTFNARTDVTHTVTLPNHTSMLTGRPVFQPAGAPSTIHHGYTSNDDPLPTDTLHNRGNPDVDYIASVFDVVHDHGLSTALYASKSKFIIFDQSYDASAGAMDAIGADNGPDKIDVYHQASSGSPPGAGLMNAALLNALPMQRFNYTFVHYRDPDSAGHTFGWASAAYNASVRDVSGYLTALFNMVETDPVLNGRTAIILSSDHGGTGFGHDLATDPRNYTIPFFVCGPGVPAGTDLYALNTGVRLDPGSTRPLYGAAVQPIRNGDGANLALALLGLPPVPGSSINLEQDLIVAPCPCELTGDGPGGAGVDAFDLLAYLDLWFAEDAAAERTGDSPALVDIFDLLALLDCWFAASQGGRCP